MATSYRNTQVTAAFPFGHGLTFAAFNFSSAAQVPCGSGGGAACVKLSVTNAGGACARAVPQLYARFPAAAKHPSPLLKGFVKTDALCAGTSADVTFRLTTRDVSYYDAGEWVVAPSLTALIGASAADVQLQLPISPAVPVSAA
jgi:beta-glucosidase